MSGEHLPQQYTSHWSTLGFILLKNEHRAQIELRLRTRGGHVPKQGIVPSHDDSFLSQERVPDVYCDKKRTGGR